MKPKIKLKGRLKLHLHWPLFLTIIPVVLAVCAYVVEGKVGLFFSIFPLIYLAFALFFYFYNRFSLLNELIHFGTDYGTVQEKMLEEFKIPYAVLGRGGTILWMNKEFAEISQVDRTYRKSIATIFPLITKELVEKEEDSTELTFEWEGRYLRVCMSKISLEGVVRSNKIFTVAKKEQYVTAFYLFDETKLHNYVIANREQTQLSALVYIDNYEEVAGSVEEMKRSLLIAMVDRKVNQYFADRDSIVKKLEKDRYFVVFQNKYMEELIQDRFSVLEDVKTIHVGNEMSLTLSVGIGVTDESYIKNHEYARMALELALGRGGDQVVVKEGEKISYYGGKNRQLEKMSRVKARVKAHALRELVNNNEHVLVMGHAMTDIDSFGAAIGIYCAARVLGKRAHIVLDEIAASIRPFADNFREEKKYPADIFVNKERALELVNQKTVLMVVDCNRPDMTECPELLNRTKLVVVFDHHRQSSDTIKNPVLSYIETYSSSACEMVAEVLQYFTENIRLDPKEADCLYAGILIDTNNFMTKAGVRTFEAAAYLKRSGADVTRVRKLLRNDMAAYKARAEVVRLAQIYRERFAISMCSAGTLDSPTVVGAQAANELLNILGIKASFVLTEYNGKVFISARSIDEINVQLVMERLGGGGHLNVAGAQFEGAGLEEVKEKIEGTLDQMIEDGDIDV